MDSAPGALAELGRAGHPQRALAVTVAAGVLSAKAGNTALVTISLVVAVLTGQLFAAWAAERLRFGDDRRAGRTDKPLVRGTLSLGFIEAATYATFVLTVFFSLLLGVHAGITQLVIVACSLVQLGAAPRRPARIAPLARSVAYVLSSALLPAVATLALPGPAWPAWWAPVAGALFGAAIACTEAIGAAAGRIPAARIPAAQPPTSAGRQHTPLTRVPWPHGVLVPGAALLLVAVAAILAFAPAHAPDAITVIGVVVAVVLTVAGARELWYEPDRRATLFTVTTLGPLFLVMVVSAGATLH